ncbi:MAG: tRNA (adenosine(37)-N6)-dimethylallyltransferase MiaA [Opitutales bacterium]|nr:tRNA (adenosine(37)-N6)-dimethylallyltransferase MiaA [Opitutales bacterium]
MDKVIIISGPTAAGKTAAAVNLAKKIGAEIISCDSVQVYKYMDIGSAKAAPGERGGIPHHLIDVVLPSQTFSVGEYVAKAKKAFDDIRARGKPVIVAGGSGFYLKSWFGAVSDELFVSEKIKAECDELQRSPNPNALLEKLLSLDSRAGEFIDIQNPRRVRPALERVMASGMSVGELKRRFETLPCPYGEIEREFINIDLPDEEIFARAKIRAQKMVERGLVEETRKLLEMGIEKNPAAASAIGYRETISAIKTQNFEGLAEEIFASTRRLIRKQRKFLRSIGV